MFREVGAFGEVLAEESVGVLVGAALLRRFGIAEVDVDASVVNWACWAISLP